jgi:hypothetical protein
MVGRIQEAALMRQLLDSPGAELLAIIGRRRVGKTYMVKQVFSPISPMKNIRPGGVMHLKMYAFSMPGPLNLRWAFRVFKPRCIVTFVKETAYRMGFK